MTLLLKLLALLSLGYLAFHLGVFSVDLQRALAASGFAHSVRRWVCRRFGHLAAADERGRPVTALYVCVRCGKIGGRIA